MSSNINDTYLEARVMSASPVELVRMLYEAAGQAVREARQHLAAGDIPSRSRQIGKASAILMELAGSLDRTRGGEIAVRLASLYDYMATRLNEANLRQSDQPLTEVLGLLETLGEAWREVEGGPAPHLEQATPVSGAPEPALFGGYGAFLGGSPALASQSWSA